MSDQQSADRLAKEYLYNLQNKAAGTRLRNALQKVKVLATDVRKEVTEKKNTK